MLSIPFIYFVITIIIIIGVFILGLVLGMMISHRSNKQQTMSNNPTEPTLVNNQDRRSLSRSDHRSDSHRADNQRTDIQRNDNQRIDNQRIDNQRIDNQRYDNQRAGNERIDRRDFEDPRNGPYSRHSRRH